MIRKLLIFVCSTVFVHAGILGTDFSPASTVSYSSFSLGPTTKTAETPIVQKAITQDNIHERLELAPIYESVLKTQDSKYYSGDGFKQRTFMKSLNTGDSKINKFKAQTSKDGVYSAVSFGSPVHTEAIYHTGRYSQEFVAPVVYASTPLKFSAIYAEVRPLAAIAKPPPTYSIGASPIVYSSKVTPGLSAFGSSSVNYDPELIKSDPSEVEDLESVTYSDTPAVSHVSFSGSKANYSW